MENKDIRKLSKYQLTRMLREQEQEIATLRQQLESLQEAYKEARGQPSEFGSLAEEAMQLSGVFDSAQKAVDKYVAEVTRRKETVQMESDRLLAETRERCRKMEAECAQKTEAAWAEIQKRLNEYLQSKQSFQDLMAEYPDLST